MDKKREWLMALARGRGEMAFIGVPVRLWPIIERGEANDEAIMVCKAITAHFRNLTGHTDRKSAFAQYLAIQHIKQL